MAHKNLIAAALVVALVLALTGCNTTGSGISIPPPPPVNYGSR